MKKIREGDRSLLKEKPFNRGKVLRKTAGAGIQDSKNGTGRITS